MNALSAGSSLIWFLAEFEAVSSHYPETTAWHFVIACFKLCDLDIEKFMQNAPEEARKQQAEVLDDAQNLKEYVNRFTKKSKNGEMTLSMFQFTN